MARHGLGGSELAILVKLRPSDGLHTYGGLPKIRFEPLATRAEPGDQRAGCKELRL